MVTFKVHLLFSSGAVTVCSIPGTLLEECRLSPALQTSRCLLLIQNGVLSLPYLWNCILVILDHSLVMILAAA